MADLGRQRERRVRTGRQQSVAVVALVGLGLVAVALGLAATGRAAGPAFIYPPDLAVAVVRQVTPADPCAVPAGGAITVTVSITNGDAAAVRGFYYSDQIPNDWPVETLDVVVDGIPVADYAYEMGSQDQVQDGFTPHRWALEVPQGGGVFSPTHPILAGGGTARIVYAMIKGGEGCLLDHDA